VEQPVRSELGAARVPIQAQREEARERRGPRAVQAVRSEQVNPRAVAEEHVVKPRHHLPLVPTPFECGDRIEHDASRSGGLAHQTTDPPQRQGRESITVEEEGRNFLLRDRDVAGKKEQERFDRRRGGQEILE
jgi:hypothetical protein